MLLYTWQSYIVDDLLSGWAVVQQLYYGDIHGTTRGITDMRCNKHRRKITRAERRAGASSDDDDDSSSSSSHNDVDIPVRPAGRAGAGGRHGRRKHAEKTLLPAAEAAAQLQGQSASAPPAQTLPPALPGAPKKISSEMLLAREEADVKRGPEGA